MGRNTFQIAIVAALTAYVSAASAQETSTSRITTQHPVAQMGTHADRATAHDAQQARKHAKDKRRAERRAKADVGSAAAAPMGPATPAMATHTPPAGNPKPIPAVVSGVAANSAAPMAAATPAMTTTGGKAAASK